MTTNAGTDHTFVSPNSPCDFVASTSERIPLTTNTVIWPTVARKADSVVVVVAILPSPFFSLCTLYSFTAYAQMVTLLHVGA